MSENVGKILELEEKLEDILESNILKTDDKCLKIVDEMSKILKRMDNYELLYILEHGVYIHQVLDVDAYFKKYKIDKKKIKEENTYKEEFRKISRFVEKVQEVSLSDAEYQFICKMCLVDDVAEYLLAKMSNDDIMELSKETDDWNYKLFLFANFKA